MNAAGTIGKAIVVTAGGVLATTSIALAADSTGRVRLLNVVNSLDTPVCHVETHRWEKLRDTLPPDVIVYTISMDLPFAQKRWCGAAGVTAVKTLSDFRERSFAQNYGVLVKEGPLAGLTARAVFVVGKDGEEAFVRRDSMQLRGEGLIGLGKAPDSNSSQVIRYACEE